MKLHLASLLAVVSWVLTAAALVLLLVAEAAGTADNLFHYQDAVVGLVYPALGWVLMRRLGSHPVGWILVLAGLSGAMGAFAEEYVTVGFDVHPGSLPAVETVAWIGSWAWAFFFALLPVLLLLFPDGMPPSPRWLPVVWLSVVPVITLPAVLAVATWGASLEVLAASDDPDLSSGIQLLFDFSVLALAAALVLAVVSLGMRWRRSVGVARQQMKVFFVCVAVGTAALVLSQLEVPGTEVIGVLAFLLVPIGMVAAILRYRLYDIDRLVSRTVTYAVITAVLLGVFFGSIFVLHLVLPAESELATAASTLAAAAAFNPLRRRIQGFIDRRFNRARYDAEQTVDAFGRDLRSQATGDVEESLVDVVASTLQPAHMSVWLHEDEDR